MSRARLRVVAGGPGPAAPSRPLASRDALAHVAKLASELQAELARLAGTAEPGPEPEAPAARLLPAKWAAYELSVSSRTVARWAAASGFGKKLAGRWLVDVEALKRWLEHREHGARRR